MNADVNQTRDEFGISVYQRLIEMEGWEFEDRR